jgi:hypothetical protein
MKRIIPLISVTVFIISLVIISSGNLRAQTQRNPVLEEFTGTWCPWCPCGHVIMEQILAGMPNAIMIGYHGGGGGDPFQYFPGNQIVSLLVPPFWPSGTVDRTGAPNDRSLWSSWMNQRFNVPATVSIDINHTFNPLNKEINATVDVTALQNLTGSYNVTLILLENGLVFSQAGNTSCQGGTNYIHKHVVRAMLNGATGEDLNSGNPWNQGQTITKSIQAYIPEEANPDSCELVVIVNKVLSPLYNAEIQQAIKKEFMDPNYKAAISVVDQYYFGESSETAEYQVYVKNIGTLPDLYNISLSFEGPAGWSQTFTTMHGTFNIGDMDTMTINPGDSASVQVTVNANSINGYGKSKIQFYSNHGTSGIAELMFTTFGLDILVVDDDGGENYEEYIQNELINLNSEYGIITSDFIPANADSLNTYNIIIWNTGVTEPGISTDEMNALAAFLDNGGRLYLNGVDIAYQMADPSSPYYSTETMNFFTNYLHSSYILREHSATIATGIDGDPITDGLGNLTLVGGTGANTIDHSAGHYPNQIAAEGMYSADILYFWLKPDEHPGIRANHGVSGKVVFTTFGFETISQEEKRTLFAEGIVEWLSNPVSVEDDQSGLPPASFNLYQNFPNPFNPVTTIKYQVSNTSPVLIKVFDIIGREVSVLVNEVKEPGTYQVSFDSKNLASGIYFYKMVAGDFTSVKKMNLLK